MRRPLLRLPTIRWPGIATSAAAAPDDIGPPWTGALTPTLCDDLLEQFAGLIRGLHLAGYTTPTIRFEHQIELTEITLPDRIITGGIAGGSSSLDPVRDTGAAFIAIQVEPLPLYGTACKMGLEIPLSLATANGVHHITDADSVTLWIAIECESDEYASSKDALNPSIIEIGRSLAADVDAHWSNPPGPGAASGLGFVFDQSNWRFPPLEASLYGRGSAGLLAATWWHFLTHYTDPSERSAWLEEEITTTRAPSFWAAGRQLGHRMKSAGGSVSQTAQAYRRRLEDTVGTLPAACRDTSYSLSLANATDAVFAHIEHGAFDPFQILDVRSDVAVQAEWTDPCLTGIHVAVDGQSTNVMLVNQAGEHVEGYLTRRVQHQNGYYDLKTWVFSLDLTATGVTQREYEGNVWEVHDDPFADQNHLVPIQDLDTAEALAGSFSTDNSSNPPVINVQFPGGFAMETFQRIDVAAHVSNQLLASRGTPPAMSNRLHLERTRVLHPAEQELADQIVDRVTDGVLEWYETSDTNRGNVYVDIENDVADLLGDEWNPGEPAANRRTGDIGRAIGWYLRLHLQAQSAAGVSSLQIMIEMLNHHGARVDSIPTILGLELVDPSGEQYWYQWRITEIDSWGGSYWFAGAAYGDGLIEFRRVDRQVEMVDGHEVITFHPREGEPNIGPYHIGLTSGVVGFTGPGPGFEYGLGDIPTWQTFDFAADHDLAPYFDGSNMSFVHVTGGVGPYSARTGIEAFLDPADGSIDLSCSVSSDLSSWATGDAERLDKMKSDKDKWKNASDAAKEIRKKGRDLTKTDIGKMSKKLVSVTFMTTDGSISSTPTSPAEADPHVIEPVDLDASIGTAAMFATDDHHVTAEFLGTLRRFLAAYLPMLTGPFTTVSIDGYASRAGDPDANFALSERRAVSVVEAVRNILGPQLAVPAGDIAAVAHGETDAGGGPDSDRPEDRRTDLTLSGVVTLSMVEAGANP